MGKFAADVGYDIVSSTLPIFFTYTDAGRSEYHQRLAEVSQIPILSHNVRGMAGRSVLIVTQAEMLKLPNVIGPKHTDMKLFSAERPLREVPDGAIFIGAEEMLTGALAMDMGGGICATNKLMPRRYLEI